MGGIKNKLSKLSNKVKTLLNSNQFLPLDRSSASGTASRRAPASRVFDDRQVAKSSEMLTIPLSDYRLTSPFSQRGTKSSLPLAKWRQMSVAHRWGRITKYLGIACLSLAALSTLALNIISSYSNSSTRSNAEPVAQSTNSTLVSGPAEISLSISPITTPTSSQCDTSNSNICMSIPDGGGIATGGHTVTVDSNATNGYSVIITSSEDSRNSDLVLTKDDGSKDYDHSIGSLPEIDTNSIKLGTDNGRAVVLENLSWGVAIPSMKRWQVASGVVRPGNFPFFADESYYTSQGQSALANATFVGVPKYGSSLVKLVNSGNQDDESINNNVDFTVSGTIGTTNVYYGVRVDNPNELLAGNYQAEVVYTATVNLPPTPTNLSVSPTTFEFDSCNDSLITIEGTNLSSAYEVYLQKSGTSDEANRLACTNLNLDSTNNQLTCNIPTSREEVELNTTYDIYVISQAASPGILKNAFTYTKPATGLSVKSDNENIIVDYDENLIPVIYVGYDGNGGGHWAVVTDAEIEQNTGNWFRYDTTEKKWANAITVTAEAREAYRKKQTGEDPDPTILPSNNPTGNGEANPEILGYWVYIPRYAYEVQRRDAIDKVVDPQNFDIVFQTADEKNTPAPSCNSADSVWVNGTPTDYAGSGSANILSKDYRTGCWPNNRTYIANSSNTTWATHPAFTWGDTEFNGIWVGKYETTGKITAPTVKPNQHANIYEYVGTFYTASKSIGKEDKCNVGGNTISGIAQDSHNLQTTKSHMLKNSEWGAITYLAHSKYGAGINTSILLDTNVQRNSAYPSSSTDADGTRSGYGITGCGPAEANETSSWGTYDNGTPLSADVIESSTACSTDTALGPKRAYNGELGVLSSTTNTIYGVYGLSGGASEYVMGNRTTNAAQTTTTNTSYFGSPAKSPYVDLYVATPNGPFDTRPSWSSAKDSQEYWYNYDVCTFETCGGTATYETTVVQSVSGYNRSWGRSGSSFVGSSDPWFFRGSDSYNSSASPFYAYSYDGLYRTSYGSRAALLALPAGQ